MLESWERAQHITVTGAQGVGADRRTSGALLTQQTTWKFIIFIALN
jgi:hypothetical protein